MNDAKTMLLNATDKQETRVAIVDADKLMNFEIEFGNKDQRKGNIYKAIITKIEMSLEACFLDYGQEKQGFLSFKDIDFSRFLEPNITEISLIEPGAEIIVQLEKEERGSKGAAFTSFISLAGRYLVLMPDNEKAGGVSRKIDFENREELKSILEKLTIPANTGVILRTAALGRNINDIEWDLNYLLKLWEAILMAGKNPKIIKKTALLYQESNLVIRSIRDHFSSDIMEVLIDNSDIYTKVHQFVQDILPNYASRIKFYQSDVPLFSFYQIEHKIQSAYARTVHLKSGGAIVLDYTEALTAIDVNSAKSNKATDIEATAFTTNLEASEEIARQIRLRDLGGLIVIDFIDMENESNKKDLENNLKRYLEIDRARVKVGKISRQFGLMTISRQRLNNSLPENSTIACPQCSGVGSIRSVESNVVHVLRLMQEDIVRNSNNFDTVHLQLPIDMATYAINEKRKDIFNLETKLAIKIVIIPNHYLTSPDYKMRVLNTSNTKHKSEFSYKLIDGILDENPHLSNQDNNNNQAAALVNFPRLTNKTKTKNYKNLLLSGLCWLKNLITNLNNNNKNTKKKPRKKYYKNQQHKRRSPKKNISTQNKQVKKNI